jgi:hypothetical protein
MKLTKRAEAFLSDHYQHSIEIYVNQKGVTVRLSCHNGYDWMGFKGRGPSLGAILPSLLDEYDVCSPAAKRTVYSEIEHESP